MSRKQNIITGIDIGTHSIKVIIAQMRTSSTPLILGTGIKSTHGLKNGYITNAREVEKSLHIAIRKAEQMANVEVENAYLGIGGVGLDSIYTKADISLPKAEGQIDEADLKKVIDKAKFKAQKDLVNRHILHTIPLGYKVDGSEVYGEPIGMRGNKLSVDLMLITTLEPHYRNMREVVENLGIDVDGVMASPVAASLVVLNSEQKEAGCVLANIGAETVSIIVYEDDNPISLKVFPTGSSDITSEIALKLQVPLGQAEELKKGALYDRTIPQKKLDDIIEARLREMFTLIKAHLKELGKDGLLPAGVVLTGGGVGLAHIKDIARVALKLPSELAQLKVPNKSVKDSTWAVAYGLCIYGSSIAEDKSQFNFKFKGFEVLKNIFKHFIP